MAKKKSLEQEQDVYGQIFDFIFKQAEKKPEKRKPIKPTGLSGKDILVDSLAATLERPGAFITTQTAKDINDSLDFTLGKIKPDETLPASVKISTSTLIDFFKNPGKAFDKARTTAQAMRKQGRVNYLAGTMRELTANAWARKYADLDTQIAVRLGLSSQNEGERVNKYQARAGIGQAGGGRSGYMLNEMENRGATLLGRRVFTEREWNRMSEADQSKYISLMTLPTEKMSYEQVQRLVPAITFTSADWNGKTEIQKREALLSAQISQTLPTANVNAIIARYRTNGIVLTNGTGNIIASNQLGQKAGDLKNPEFYRGLEIGNIHDRIAQLQAGGMGLSRQETADRINALQKAELLIRGQDLSAANMKKVRTEIDRRMSGVQTLYDHETDPNRRKELSKELKELGGMKREMGSLQFWDRVGNIEGVYYSLQEITQGGLITGILNGDFFDKNRNKTFLRPSTDSDGKYKFATGGVKGIDFIIPEEVGDPNSLRNAYARQMTAVYYMTPRSLVRTFLYNGELFGYLAHVNKTKANKMLAGLGFNELSEDNLKALLNGTSSQTISTLLSGWGLNGADAAKMEKYLKSISSNLKTFSKLSVPAQIRAKFTNWVESKLIGVRRKIYNQIINSKLFTRLSPKILGSLSKDLLTWVEKGGLQTIAKAIVVAVADALGIVVSGGTLDFLITIVASALSDVLFSLGKVLAQVLVWSLAGLVCLIGVVWFLFMGWQRQTYSYSYEVPGEVYVNPNFSNPGDVFNPGGEPGDPGTVYNGTAQEIFAKVMAEMGLSGITLNLVTCPGPANVCAYSEGTWCVSSISNKTINCKANEIASVISNPAYLTNLMRHELTHQIQGYYGPDYLLEWGADYFSNNAGGYSFQISSGACVKATDTISPLLQMGCTREELNQVALTTKEGVNSNCGRIVVGYVKAFCRRP
jgi:hypothetical protein